MYSYVVACLIGRQYLILPTSMLGNFASLYNVSGATGVISENISAYYPDKDYRQHIDLYVPVFTLVELCVYLGWLRVAETLLNPRGEDDDDFDFSIIIHCFVEVMLDVGVLNDVPCPIFITL